MAADNYATSFHVSTCGATSGITLIAQDAAVFMTHGHSLDQGEYHELRKLSGLLLQTLGFLLHPQHPDTFTSGKPDARLPTAHLLDLLTFSWEGKLFHTLRNASINKDLLPRIGSSLQTGHLMGQIPEYQSDQKLWAWLLRAYYPQVLKQWTLAAIKAITQILPQYVLFYLLQALEANPMDRKVILCSALYGLSLVAEVWVKELVLWFTMAEFQIPLQAVLSSLVYRKTLKLPNLSEGHSEEKSPKQPPSKDSSLTQSIDNHLQLDT